MGCYTVPIEICTGMKPKVFFSGLLLEWSVLVGMDGIGMVPTTMEPIFNYILLCVQNSLRILYKEY